MSQNCNRVIAFDPETLDRKSSLGRSASSAVHAALSDCYRAVEDLETRQAATGAEVVYLRAAAGKFEAAAQALRGMRDILVTGTLSDAAVAWFEALDYSRLYEAGVQQRLIPASLEQWSRLVALVRSLDHLAVTDRLIADVGDLRREIDSLISFLLSGAPGAPLTAEHTQRLLRIQTALVQFSTFAQMVAYLNAVEPLDQTWCRHVDTAELATAG
jgi:hypothetical protein